jgi:putative tricarboxylic transport membrane protein
MMRDLVLGSMLLGISGAYYALASTIPGSQLDDAVGARGLPNVYAILLAVFSLLLIARALRTRHRLRPMEKREQTDLRTRPIGRPLGMLAVGVLYIAVVPLAGYLVSVAALIVATASYQGAGASPTRADSWQKGTRGTTQVLLVGIAGASILWLVFVILLRIPQPAGIWSSLW